MIPTETVGPIELRVFTRSGEWGTEVRLDLRTPWSGINTDARRLPELIAALQRIESHAHAAGLLTTQAEAA